jgi:hypothetical protein
MPSASTDHPRGGDRPQDIQHIFEDRMEPPASHGTREAAGIKIEGKSDCGQFIAGYKFMLSAISTLTGRIF